MTHHCSQFLHTRQTIPAMLSSNYIAATHNTTHSMHIDMHNTLHVHQHAQHTPCTSTCTTHSMHINMHNTLHAHQHAQHTAIPSPLPSSTFLCTQLTNTKHSWQNGTRCRDGVNVLWCRSHLVRLVFEHSIPTCACFPLENFFGLLDKLQDLGLDEHIRQWVKSYLTDRSQKVVVNGESSDPTHVVSGVPQGSVLGPLLFLVYIDGVTDLPLSEASQLVLYADDILLYRPIKCQSDYSVLQQEMNAINSWVEDNHLQFNISKCKHADHPQETHNYKSSTTHNSKSPIGGGRML